MCRVASKAELSPVQMCREASKAELSPVQMCREASKAELSPYRCAGSQQSRAVSSTARTDMQVASKAGQSPVQPVQM
jgi:hypothetical protein